MIGLLVNRPRCSLCHPCLSWNHSIIFFRLQNFNGSLTARATLHISSLDAWHVFSWTIWTIWATPCLAETCSHQCQKHPNYILFRLFMQMKSTEPGKWGMAHSEFTLVCCFQYQQFVDSYHAKRQSEGYPWWFHSNVPVWSWCWGWPWGTCGCTSDLMGKMGKEVISFKLKSWKWCKNIKLFHVRFRFANFQHVFCHLLRVFVQSDPFLLASV